jgi:hypothetical protein
MLFPEEEARIETDRIEDWPEDIKKRHDTWYESLAKCPECGLETPRFKLADSYGFNTTLDVVADRLVDMFRKLDSNADVYMVRTKRDYLLHMAKSELRENPNPDMARYRRLLEEARDRDKILYLLKDIIKDTTGGNLKKRFLSLLRA